MTPELMTPELVRVAWAAAAVAVVLAVAVAVRRPRARAGVVRVAHTERLRQLPAYRRAVLRRRAALVCTVVVVAAMIGVGGYVAARPTLVQTRQSQLDNRDIVLCLDVSGSMAAQNLAIIQTFRQLVAGLEGERIALVMFNSTPLVIHPLTDDYDLIRARLEQAEESLEEAERIGKVPQIAAGASNMALGQSLVGDGLMGCAQQFSADAQLAVLRAQSDQPATGSDAPTSTPSERSRVIILATDNKQMNARGGQLFTVSDAAGQAEALGATIVVLDAGDDPGAGPAQELAAAAQLTGGRTYPAATGAGAVEEITAIVESLDSVVVAGEPVTSRFDVPGRALGALLALTVALLLAWGVARP